MGATVFFETEIKADKSGECHNKEERPFPSPTDHLLYVYTERYIGSSIYEASFYVCDRWRRWFRR